MVIPFPYHKSLKLKKNIVEAKILTWPYSQSDVIRNHSAKIKVKHKKKA